MSYYARISTANSLTHYGKKGMKWKHRKEMQISDEDFTNILKDTGKIAVNDKGEIVKDGKRIVKTQLSDKSKKLYDQYVKMVKDSENHSAKDMQHSDDTIMHYGKKGMKWKHRKKSAIQEWQEGLDAKINADKDATPVDPVSDARQTIGGGQNGKSYLARVLEAHRSADKKSGYSATKLTLQKAIYDYKVSKRSYKNTKEAYKSGDANKHDVKAAKYNKDSKKETYKSARQTNGASKKAYREEYHRKMYGTSSTSKNGAR